jgi:cyclopropane fatty-acyl-phospholipid synthase-like methyltransferase
MSDPRTRLVGEGYDVIGDRFVEWRNRIAGDPRDRWTDALTSRLEDGARVLELGCGRGVPDTRLLADRFRVTGVDISAEQIRHARANVPKADFVLADFTTLDLEPASFDAVAAFYSFNHVPRELLGDMFSRINTWLVPGGFLLASLGAQDTPDWTGDFLGAPTFFSGYPPDVNRRLLAEAGFERVLDEVVTFQEPEGEATFQWVLART